MRILLFILTSLVITNLQAQESKDLYVINETNHLMKVGDGYVFEYRDLKFIKKHIRSLKFDSKEEILDFFDKAENTLNTDQGVLNEKYSMYRHKLNKNTVRINNKDGGYVLLTRETLENMRNTVQ
jgi:hypothetical protein